MHVSLIIIGTVEITSLVILAMVMAWRPACRERGSGACAAGGGGRGGGRMFSPLLAQAAGSCCWAAEAGNGARHGSASSTGWDR